jgi:hypothetical protein
MKTLSLVTTTVLAALAQSGVCYAQSAETLDQKNSLARTVLAANQERGVLMGTNHNNEACQVESHLFDLTDTHGQEDNPYLGLFQLRVFFDTNDSWQMRLFEDRFGKSRLGNQLRYQDGNLLGRILLNSKVVVVKVKYDQDNMITKIERHFDGKLVQSCTVGN